MGINFCGLEVIKYSTGIYKLSLFLATTTTINLLKLVLGYKLFLSALSASRSQSLRRIILYLMLSKIISHLRFVFHRLFLLCTFCVVIVWVPSVFPINITSFMSLV